MFDTLLIIDPADSLILIDFIDESVCNLAALILCLWKLGRDIHRRSAEERWINLIPYEWQRQVDWPPRIAGRRGKSSEVARQHRRRWNKSDRRSWIRTSFRALISAEEEELIPGYGSAERSPVLVAL